MISPGLSKYLRNCSEPSRFSCKSVNHACMNEHFYMEIYLADTPHRRNAQHFGGGSEQLRICKQKNVQKTDVSVREIVKSVREQKSTERKKHPFMKTADRLQGQQAGIRGKSGISAFCYEEGACLR